MKKLYSIAGITKVVAGSTDNPDAVLILLTENARADIPEPACSQ